MTRFPAAASALAALALVPFACGGDDDPRLTVAAASSLQKALTSCSADFPNASVRLTFAGSDELAAQIRQGTRFDVYAAANEKLPNQLREEGRLEDTVPFATNELVLAVASGSGKVRSLEDLEAPGVKLAVGSESVPVGSYTQQVLARLPSPQRSRILRNVRSREPDVKGVVGKLTQRAVDAGFVYATDVDATDGKLEAIKLPQRLQPTVAYGAGVVEASSRPALARRFLGDVLGGACARALRQAGFGPPPR